MPTVSSGFVRLMCAGLLVAVPGGAGAQTSVASRAQFMAGVIAPPTSLGFDQFPPGTVLTGNEYEPAGVTFQHLAGQAMKVARWTPIPGLIIPSPPNVMSSSYASEPGPGFSPACCGVYFNNSHADHFRFNFSPAVRSAGIQLGENDFRGTTVRWLDASGAVIASRFYGAGNPSMDVVGLTGSPVPIAAMEVFNGANDGDGMYFDDLMFEPFATVRPGPIAFIGNLGANTVSVLDVAAGAISATVAACGSPGPVTMSPDRNYFYVFCYDGHLASIDTRTLGVVTRSLGLSFINGIQTSPDGKRIYAAGGLNDVVWVIDTATLTLVTSFAVNDGIAGGLDNHNGLTFNSAGTRLYVTQCGFNCALRTVTVIDTATHAPVAQIRLDASGPSTVAIDPADEFLYVSHYGAGGTGSSVSVVDLATHEQVASIGAGAAPYAMAINGSGTRLYVTNYHSNSVSVIDTTARAVVATITVGSNPSGVAVTADARRLIVTNLGNDTISIVDLSTNAVIATVPGGPGPNAYGNGRFVTAEPVPAPAPTTLNVAQATATYGGVVTLSATLLSGATPLAGRAITFRLGETHVGVATTDSGGTAILPSATTAGFGAGAHSGVVTATFDGEPAYGPSTGHNSLTVTKATPVLTWELASPIVYGTALDSARLNASADVDGTFEYSPPPGFIPGAGSHQLEAIFTPADAANFNAAVLSRTLDVTPAFAQVSVGSLHKVYSGRPQPLSANVTGVFGEHFDADLMYRNSTAGGEEWTATPPTDAGHYEVQVSAAIDSINYVPVLLTVTYEIDPATATIAVADAVFVYDGEPHPVLANAFGVLGEDLGVVAVDYLPGAVPPVDAGAYTVTVSFAGSANYAPASATAFIQIGRATPVMSAVGGDFVYDGRAHAVIVSVTGVRGESLEHLTTTEYAPGGPAAPLNAGLYAAVVRFEGTANYEPIQSGAAIAIARATPTVAVAGGTFAYDGQPHGATASATGVLGENLGAVAIEYLPGPGVPVAAGTYTALASFAGNANYEPATQSAFVVIEPGAATVQITGGSFAYDGQLHAATGTVTGIVGESLGPLTFAYNGAAAPPIDAGTYEVIGTFPGNANYRPASATATIQIAPVPLAIVALNASKMYGQPNPTFAVTVIGLVAGDSESVLQGEITFTTDATASSVAGVYQVTPGDVTARNYQITFVPAALTITPASSALTISSSANPAGYLQSIALRADVAIIPSGAGMATGTAEFFDGTTPIGSATVIAGAATINVILDPGSHEVTARYLGSSDVMESSATLTQVVNPRNASTTATLRVRPRQSNLGDTVAFDVDVSGGTSTLTGAIELYDGGTLLATAAISGRSAAFAVTSLTAGSHTFTAKYTGDVENTPSLSSPVVHTVLEGNALERSSVSLSPKRAQAGQPIAVEIIVSGNGSAPIGTAALYLDGAVIAELPLVASGARTSMAAHTLAALPAGTHILTAVYGGSSTHAGSTAEVQLRVR